MGIDEIRKARLERKQRRLELLPKYDGMHVAWAKDEMSVLAASESIDELFAELDRREIPSSAYILEYVSGEAII